MLQPLLCHPEAYLAILRCNLRHGSGPDQRVTLVHSVLHVVSQQLVLPMERLMELLEHEGNPAVERSFA